MKTITPLAFTLILASCAVDRTPQELAALDYGPYPENYKVIIQNYFSTRLRDPYSAVLDYKAGPRQLWQKSSAVSRAEHGWGVCVYVNAKNAFGAFVGVRPYAFFIRDNRVVLVHGEMRDNMFDQGLAKAACEDLGGG